MRRALVSALMVAGLLAGCGRQEQAKPPTAPKASDTSLPATLYKLGNARALTALGDNSVEPEPTPGPSEAGVVIRSKATALNPQGDGNSVIVRLPDAVRNALAGNTGKVFVRARSAASNGSPVFRVFYSRPGVGSSGWQEFRPTADFQDFAFAYSVPADVKAAYSPDLVGIWADPEGKGRGIEVSVVRIEAAGPE